MQTHQEDIEGYRAMRSTLEKSYRSAEQLVGSLEQQRKDFQQQVAALGSIFVEAK